jgi:hypothetical protein
VRVSGHPKGVGSLTLAVVATLVLGACAGPSPTPTPSNPDPIPGGGTPEDPTADVPELVGLLEEARNETAAAAQSIANGAEGPSSENLGAAWEDVRTAFNSWISEYQTAIRLGEPVSYTGFEDAAAIADAFIAWSDDWAEQNRGASGGGGAMGAPRPETVAKVIAELLPAVIEVGTSIWDKSQEAEQAQRQEVVDILEQQRWPTFQELGLTVRESAEPSESSAGPTSDGLDPSLAPNSGSTDLAAGFVPDPFSQDLVSGGPIDVSYLGDECEGFATAASDYRVSYESGLADLLRFYFVADAADTTLIINAPDGSWHCNDDAPGTINPMIDFVNPESGRYDIWVGSFEEAMENSGALYVTEVGSNNP